MELQVLKCLHYFDLFDHPLNVSEIHRFLQSKAEESEIKIALQKLIATNSAYSFQDYYGLLHLEKKVHDRIKYEKNAFGHHETSVKHGHIILNIPFVSGVCISGSLSKGVMKDDADIDYFIFAKSGKIWLAKFFVKAYKFLILKNRKELFCTNYFISDENLTIEEQNLYTATELATLIPISSKNLYDQLLLANTWYKTYLPNISIDDTNYIERPFNKSKIKRWTELILNNPLGSILNYIIRSASVLRNHLKYNNKKNKDFELMYRSTFDQIKVHDSNHQKNTLRKYNSNITKTPA